MTGSRAEKRLAGDVSTKVFAVGEDPPPTKEPATNAVQRWRLTGMFFISPTTRSTTSFPKRDFEDVLFEQAKQNSYPLLIVLIQIDE